MHYRSIATLNKQLRGWLGNLPHDLELIAGTRVPFQLEIDQARRAVFVHLDDVATDQLAHGLVAMGWFATDQQAGHQGGNT